jgi:centromere/kinetochore protein ZW10
MSNISTTQRSIVLTSQLLQTEIQKTSREVAPDVDSWIQNAKTLQDDIDSSKRLANEILRLAEADEQRQELLKEQDDYLEFLENEVKFNNQLGEALLLIGEINERLDEAETLVYSGKILEALHMLQSEF